MTEPQQGGASWDRFKASVAEAHKLSQPEDFDYLSLWDGRYTSVRKFAPLLLTEFEFHAAPPATADRMGEFLVPGQVNMKQVHDHCQDILRLLMSIKIGTVTASVILRKLERTLFTLDWLEDPELRRRSHGGLNNGEQQNSLRRAVFLNRLGEIRDRSYQNQRYTASSLNLLVATIILWNTVYLQRAVDHLRKLGIEPGPDDLAHLSPLGWEHINLTGDYAGGQRNVKSGPV